MPNTTLYGWRDAKEMKQKDQMTQRLIAEFTENYLETLFYFCLKKTGSRDEAEKKATDKAQKNKTKT